MNYYFKILLEQLQVFKQLHKYEKMGEKFVNEVFEENPIENQVEANQQRRKNFSTVTTNQLMCC